jgi:hypothetical protein
MVPGMRFWNGRALSGGRSIEFLQRAVAGGCGGELGFAGAGEDIAGHDSGIRPMGRLHSIGQAMS